MKIINTRLDNCLIIEPKVFGDDRGFFLETFHLKRYSEQLNFNFEFVQDNHSFSWRAGTLRGLHFQSPENAQAKLVRCGTGAIFDVAVDIRKDSPKFGQWEGYELSAENGHQLYIPVGFAHGFVTLKPRSEIIYKCTGYYAPEAEGYIRWDDPSIGIEWPIVEKLIINKKDADAPYFNDIDSPFMFGENS